MTQTVQPLSPVLLCKVERQQENSKQEDNMSLLLSILDNMNVFCEQLNKLDYVLKRNIELIGKKHGINKENT
jgi:hypothetical protein